MLGMTPLRRAAGAPQVMTLGGMAGMSAVSPLGRVAGTSQVTQAGPSRESAGDICTTERACGADWPWDCWPRSGTSWPWDWWPRSATGLTTELAAKDRDRTNCGTSRPGVGQDWPRDWRPSSGTGLDTGLAAQ